MHACGNLGVVGRSDECLTQLILIYYDEEKGFLSRFRFLSDPTCFELSLCLFCHLGGQPQMANRPG